jgi:mitochondrial enoyl-[acyl-carrier protein] reductase / trans-2-enoyl-CoA reductase
MQAIQFSRFGIAADVAELVELPDPGPPGEGEVVIDIVAAPIHPSNLSDFEGKYGVVPPKLPSFVGTEALGRVAQVGAGVTHLKEGDRVLAIYAGRGNWRQRKKVRAQSLFPLPPGGDPLQLAMMAVNPTTAWLLLDRYVSLRAGDWIVQDAANSGVGHCVIALAKAMGVHTINVVRRADQVDKLKALGGDVVLLDGPDLAVRVGAALGQARPRLACDAVGGETTSHLANCLGNDGVVAIYGRLSGQPCVVDGAAITFRNISLRGCWLAKWFEATPAEERRRVHETLFRSIADGTINVPVEASYELGDIKAAVAHAARPGRSGKIMLLPNGKPG